MLPTLAVMPMAELFRCWLCSRLTLASRLPAKFPSMAARMVLLNDTCCVFHERICKRMLSPDCTSSSRVCERSMSNAHHPALGVMSPSLLM